MGDAASTPQHVLFVCTGNSARSILAEALFNRLAAGRMRAFSAGSHPKGEVNPGAIAELQRLKLPVDGLCSKSWDEFAQPGAPQLDFVITVCDRAAGEVCPVWPGQPISAHWGLPDPAAVDGDEAARARAFHDTAVALRRRIELMLALPMAALDRLALQKELGEIGRTDEARA